MLSYTLAINGVSIGLVGRVLASYKIAPALTWTMKQLFIEISYLKKYLAKRFFNSYTDSFRNTPYLERKREDKVVNIFFFRNANAQMSQREEKIERCNIYFNSCCWCCNYYFRVSHVHETQSSCCYENFLCESQMT